MKNFTPAIETLEEKINALQCAIEESRVWLKNWAACKESAIKKLKAKVEVERKYWNSSRNIHTSIITHSEAHIKVLNTTIEELRKTS